MHVNQDKLGKFFVFALFLIVLSVIVFSYSSSEAAPLSVWIDYDIHEQDVIQVKLYDGLPIRAENGRLQITDDQQKNSPMSSDLQDLTNGEWEHIFELDEPGFDDVLQRANNNSDKSLPDLGLYFHLHLDEGQDAAEVIADLRKSPLVEGAYPVDKLVAPPLPPDYLTSNDSNFDPNTNMNMYQRYLDAAPKGMDVRYAWEGNGGTGDGISICDVEYGWRPHTDLPPVINLLPWVQGDYTDDFIDHGTPVLGLLGAKDNGWGTKGMVPDARLLFSPVKPLINEIGRAPAISRCVTQLDPGDVILIEQQTGGQNGNFVPTEWDPSVYAIIETAVAAGIVVVEAAGNGGEDLDDVFYQTAKPGHTPFVAANDSGAIIVGAANSPWTADERTRSETSTYGDTVDLHAWGMHSIAPGVGPGVYYNEEGDSLAYTLFSGTSGASPMVTAAVVIVQGNYIAKNGTAATPAQVKQLLQDTGTPQEAVNGENIGPMPDLRAAINTIWNLTDPATPIISPASGAYSPPLAVTIDYGSASQNSSNTHIRYTLDGSEPTIDSYIYIPEQGDTITLFYTAEVRAKAFSANSLAGRLIESETASTYFGLVAPKVTTPQISPNGGSYTQGQVVTISTTTPGATIRYRTDGRAPSFFYPGTLYEGPIMLSPGTYNIVARAYKDGFYKSDAAYAEQLTINPITLPSPTVYPNSGTFNGQVTVYMGSTVLGGQIRYTTNGAEPTQYSSLFVDPFTLTSDTTVKAKLFLDGYTPSNTMTMAYDVITDVAAPTFTPVSGTTAYDSLAVSLNSTTPGAIIRYTTNGAEPTSYSTMYSSSFNLLPGQHTVKARTFLDGVGQSQTSTANYTVYNTAVSVDPPEIDPPGGLFNGPITVTLTSDTEDAFLFYTLDASDPASSGTVQPYNGPFQLPGGDTYYVRARAYLSGSGNSDMTAANITVVTPTLGTVLTPTISPVSGQYTNTVSVQVEATDFSSPFNIRKLYVTTDGTNPVAEFDSPGVGVGGVYNFSISSPQTVMALSAQQGWFDSEIAVNEYTFICDTPTIHTGGTYIDTTNVSISTGTSSATIYYTTDGSEPTPSDTEYTGSFALTESKVVKAICVRNNFEQSETAVSVFIINESPVTPSITTQPQNQTAETCTSATFAVTAVGSDPLTYTWFKDGNIIGGANEPEFTVAAALLADAGSYSVRIANSVGDVTSNGATLTVNGTDSSCSVMHYIYLPTIIK